MTQPELNFTPPTHRTRESARVAAQSGKVDCYRRLRAVFRVIGRNGLTADEACWRAGLEWRQGRPRVSEMLNSDNPLIRCLVAIPDAPRRGFVWPGGMTVQPAAVLMLMERTDTLARLHAMAAAERLAAESGEGDGDE